MVETETERDLREIGAMRATEFECFAPGVAHLRWSRMPIWSTAFGQDAHVKRGGVDEADPVCARERSQLTIHVGDQQVVAAVAQDGVDGHVLSDADQGRQRVSGNSDVTNFPLLLQLAKCRNGFVDDLLNVTELDIMDLEQVEVVGPKAAQGLVKA